MKKRRSVHAAIEFDNGIALIISFSGWLLLLAYLYKMYLASGLGVVALVFSSGSTAQAQYTLLILFAPLISSIFGYIVHKRIVKYRNSYLKEAHFKNLAENELIEIINSLILAFVNALDAKSTWTKGHSMRVQHYSRELALELGIDAEKLQILEVAALLHDIGKIGTYDDILNKVGTLTPEEYRLVKMHPDHAVHILEPIRKFRDILPVIKHHHERMDGHGYPDGLTGLEIPVLARILCVADAYDAITSERPYKAHMHKDAAVQEIMSKIGTQFDPPAVAALVKIYNSSGFHLLAEAVVNREETNVIGKLSAQQIRENHISCGMIRSTNPVH
jgi:putative nucleotidyltransferase with HDIG domain